MIVNPGPGMAAAVAASAVTSATVPAPAVV
jgi:hypothetical protein